MSVILVIAAGMVAAPIPDGAALVQKYPSWAVGAEESAGAIVSVWVDPKGRVFECETLSRIGSERLADEICDLVSRVRMSPAIDRSGDKTFGNVVGLIKFTIPDTKEGDKIERVVQRPDLALELNRMPEGVAAPYELHAAIEVDTTGAVVACNGTGEDDVAALVNLACQRLTGEPFERATDKDGLSISYVRSLKVRFSTASEQ